MMKSPTAKIAGRRNPPRIPKEEFARRGEEIFERDIKPLVEGKNSLDFVAIDITSGAYEVDANELTAGDRLLSRFPDAYIWMRRVGSPDARRFGGSVRRTANR